ncbi:hypothetical protein ANN_07003 [Periplaneta americana]|uniref:Uncharacterized protein n=1 Tax=Periplaneta americana TaxID=6978 RepID=A0ABQ8THI2_PERAM|nr:hypothetical protein ANN_07003 [Periplaneta americana]
MAGLCEGGNEPSVSLKVICEIAVVGVFEKAWKLAPLNWPLLTLLSNTETSVEIELAGSTLDRSRRSQAKPSTWSPNSPGLTPPDFFVWGFVKDIVYSQKPRNIDDLREGTKPAVQVAVCTPVLRASGISSWRHDIFQTEPLSEYATVWLFRTVHSLTLKAQRLAEQKWLSMTKNSQS